MVWTKELPNIPGHYWIRGLNDSSSKFVTNVTHNCIKTQKIWVVAFPIPMNLYEYCYIPEPKEPTDAPWHGDDAIDYTYRDNYPEDDYYGNR